MTDGFRVAVKVGRASREDDSERPRARRLFFPSQVYFRTSFGRYQSSSRESVLACKSFVIWRARRDSNPRPAGSKPDALSN